MFAYISGLPVGRIEKHLNAIIEDNGWQACLDAENFIDDWPLPNVWLGVSAEDQQRADGPRILHHDAFGELRSAVAQFNLVQIRARREDAHRARRRARDQSAAGDDGAVVFGDPPAIRLGRQGVAQPGLARDRHVLERGRDAHVAKHLLAMVHELRNVGDRGRTDYVVALAQLSFNETVRLNTGRPPVESGSAQK